MQRPGVPSLDQLAVFLTVVETGSFAAAGRRLGRATSAVSYAIANLEQQLGVQLFDRDQARRPALTGTTTTAQRTATGPAMMAGRLCEAFGVFRRCFGRNGTAVDLAEKRFHHRQHP